MPARAARCATSIGAAGCLALAFPLHPPGKPEKSRLDELLGAGVPTLVVQGENDTFGRPEEFPEDVEMSGAPGRATTASRSPSRAPITSEEAMGILVEATLEWIIREVVGESTGGEGVVPMCSPSSTVRPPP